VRRPRPQSFLILELSALVSLISKPPKFVTESKQFRRFTSVGRELFLLVWLHGYLAVPDMRISNGWFHALSYSQNQIEMKQLSFLQLVITTLLAMTVLYTTNAFAKVYMGKITLEVGDTYEVSAVPTSGYTASGSFSKNGTNFTITANGSYYCKIKANKVGTGTLSYLGTVARSNSWTTETYDMYWDVVVEKSPEPDPDPNDKTEEEISEPTDDWCKSGNYSISWFSKTKTEFSISTNKELAGMAYLINNGYTEFEGCTIKLCADIDLSGKKWIQCKTFKGTFDGQGHIISGIYMGSEKEEQTEFGFWQRLVNANISNLTLEGTTSFYAKRKSDYDVSAGGLAGYAGWASVIRNCKVNMNVNFTRGATLSSTSTTPLQYYREAAVHCNVGGIIGYLKSGIIQNCVNSGSIKCYFRESMIPQGVSTSGIAGYCDDGTVEFCENLSPLIKIEDADSHDFEFLRYVNGITHSSFGAVKCCRSIINEIDIHIDVDSYRDTPRIHISGIEPVAKAVNCYSVIRKINVDTDNSRTIIYYGGISSETYGNSPQSCFSNNDMGISINLSKVTVNSRENGSDAFSSEQMKTPAFLEELNMYSIIEADGPVWTQPAEGGYPYIAALYEPTGINTIYSVEAKPTTVFSLSGQRLAAPKKGVNIVGGKKVVVK